MTNTNRITEKSALLYAIQNLPDAPIEYREKWEKMLANIDKRNAAPKQMTEQQKKNEVIKAAIVDFLTANSETGYTVSELITNVPECNGDTTQHISALVRALDLDKVVTKYVEKRRTYVKIAA